MNSIAICMQTCSWARVLQTWTEMAAKLFLLPFLKLLVHGTALDKNTSSTSLLVIISSNPAIKIKDNFCPVDNRQHYTFNWLNLSPRSEVVTDAVSE